MTKTLSETVDMLCLIIIIIGTVVYFSFYFTEDYRLQYTMHLTESFFDEAERVQQVTEDAYEKFLYDIKGTDSRYEITMRIQKEMEIFQEEEIRRKIENEGSILLQAGDVITFYLNKGKEKCAVMQRIIRW